jgi:hypothetical protein
VGKFKGTKIGEPDGLNETLVLYPSFHQDSIYLQTIYVSGSEDTVSVASLQNWDTGKNHGSNYFHFWFTPEEIDLLVIGLLQAKAKIEKTQ